MLTFCIVLHMHVRNISMHMCAHSMFTCSKIILLFRKTVGNNFVNSSVLIEYGMLALLLPTIF